MRMRKILCIALFVVMVCVTASHALSLGEILGVDPDKVGKTEIAPQTENALSPRPEDSVYVMLKLDDTSGFLKWLFSREHIDLFMPLIISHEDSNEIMGVVEVFSSIAENSPIKSLAVVSGINKEDAKQQDTYFQLAFTVSPEAEPYVKKIADGNAEASDFARLLLGVNSPLLNMAETMLKAEREDDMYKVDNELFVKAHDGLIVMGSSANEVKSALNALNNEESRLFTGTKRRFTAKDFAFVHCDLNTASMLDDDGDDKTFAELDPGEVFECPLDVEFAFTKLADKFIMSTGLNFTRSLKKDIANRVAESNKNASIAKGGHIDLTNAGTKSPLLALGGYLNIAGVKEIPGDDAKDVWNFIVKQLKNRFGITEEEFVGLFTGPFSFVVNDSVTYEGFKIPAIYTTQTGQKDSAAKVFAKLTKSPHFQKVKEGVLQVDSSLSPVSCLIQDKGESLGIDFAELATLGAKPEIKPALNDIINVPAVMAIWLDFSAIQSWLNDDENGVMMMLAPLATFAGYGKHFQAFRDILGAELSVPTMSIRLENYETLHTEFGLADVNPENGLITKIIKVYRDFNKKK